MAAPAIPGPPLLRVRHVGVERMIRHADYWSRPVWPLESPATVASMRITDGLRSFRMGTLRREIAEEN
jgi:hypothetical protein